MTLGQYPYDRAARLMAPRPSEVSPHPEGNITTSYAYDAMQARAWWGFILHAYRASRRGVMPGTAGRQAWQQYDRETDAWLAANR